MPRVTKTVTREVQVEVWQCASCKKEEGEREVTHAYIMGVSNDPPRGWFTLTEHLYSAALQNSSDKTAHLCSKRCLDAYVAAYKAKG